MVIQPKRSHSHKEWNFSKAIVIHELLKSPLTRSELKARLKYELTPKDIDYLVAHPGRGLVSEGVIHKGKDGRLRPSVTDTGGLVKLCSILLSNPDTAESLVFSLRFILDISKTFIQDKAQFLREIIQKYDIFKDVKTDKERLKSEGVDVLQLWNDFRTGKDIEETVNIIIHVIKSNLQLDRYIEHGITDPPYELHGEFYATGLSNIQVSNRGLGKPYFPLNDSDLEVHAVKEFFEGILVRSINGEMPMLSFLRPTKKRDKMIMMMDKADMKLNSFRGKTASQIAKLRIIQGE